MNQAQTILLVDDSANDVMLFRRAAGHAGISNPVATCEDGREALSYLDHCGEHLPGLILCDLKMPGMSGVDVLTAVKGNLRWRVIPMIMFSSSCLPHDVNNSFFAGADGFLVKPLDNGELRTMLQRLAKRCPDVIRADTPTAS
jgi:CheY-like chemotaxis protein